MRRTAEDRIALLTREQLATKLGVSVWTTYAWTRRGLLPRPVIIVPGGPQRWRTHEIAAWLDDLQSKPRKAKLRGALAKLAH